MNQNEPLSYVYFYCDTSKNGISESLLSMEYFVNLKDYLLNEDWKNLPGFYKCVDYFKSVTEKGILKLKQMMLFFR